MGEWRVERGRLSLGHSLPAAKTPLSASLHPSVTRFASYVICTSPRSGSTLLCRLLREVGTAGHPESYFHVPSIDSWCDGFGLRREDFATKQSLLQAVFDATIQQGRGGSRIFGLRMQRHSFAYFAGQLGKLHPTLRDDKSRFDAAFGKTLFIHLTRRDKVDQAISFVKAEQSGLWHMGPDGAELERLSQPKPLVYDAAAIAAQYALSQKMDAEWADWFAAQQIDPLLVHYEDLAAAPYATLGRVLEALGLGAEHLVERAPPVAKLADHINQQWAERFRSEELG